MSEQIRGSKVQYFLLTKPKTTTTPTTTTTTKSRFFNTGIYMFHIVQKKNLIITNILKCLHLNIKINIMEY